MKIKLLNYIDLLFKKVNNDIEDLKKNGVSNSSADDPIDHISLIDRNNGFTYELFIEDGELKTSIVPNNEINLFKTSYIAGEKVSINDIEIINIFNDGTEEIAEVNADDIKISPAIIGAGTTSITIKYKRTSKTFNIEVTEDKTIIDEVNGFEILTLDIPEEDFSIDLPPGIKEAD